MSGCNFCGNEGFQTVFRPRAPLPGNISIVRCTRCQLLYTHPMPTPEQLANRYDENYFKSQTPFEGGYENYLLDAPITKRTFQRRLGLFLPFLGKSARLSALDVGCATGVFLEVLRELGWNAYGIEISDFARRMAREKGFTVSEAPLEKTEYARESFDLITLWDVIEHVSDPLRSIQICHDLLKPNGCLVITTPDASALLARISRNYWMGFRSVGEHVYFFDRKTMTRYLEKSGFRKLRIASVGKYFSIERILTRLGYYTRIFRIPLPSRGLSGFSRVLYINSGDTMCVVARKANTPASF